MKMDLSRVIELTSITIFGFIGFLKTIYDWSDGNTQTTIVSAVLFWVIIAVVGIIYVLWKEKGEKDA